MKSRAAPLHDAILTSRAPPSRSGQARGYAVVERVSSPADCDLLLLAKQGCLVPGLGGFSDLAHRYALETNASVFTPPSQPSSTVMDLYAPSAASATNMDAVTTTTAVPTTTASAEAVRRRASEASRRREYTKHFLAKLKTAAM